MSQVSVIAVAYTGHGGVKLSMFFEYVAAGIYIEEHGESGYAIVRMYLRLRWGIKGARPPAPPMMSSGFCALAFGNAWALPMRPTSCFGGPLPRAFPWQSARVAAGGSSTRAAERFKGCYC